MNIHELLGNEVVNDYFTANIKSEVILDTILTPVIGDILTVSGNSRITGKMRLLAKEFPMLLNKQKETSENKTDYRSCNADYLMCDDKFVYLVELKTTNESFSKKQLDKMIKYVKRLGEKPFGNSAGKEFLKLLNHVYKTEYSSKEDCKTNDLKQLFEAIVNQPQYEKHTVKAIKYLKEHNAKSSKKYLFTAGQMLDRMGSGEWWNKKIKLLYLMPKKPSVKQIYLNNEDIIIVTFQDIIKQADAIGRETESQEYWEWVVKILNDVF